MARSPALPLSLGAIGALYLVSIALARSLPSFEAPELVGLGVTLDLTVTSTAIVWLALVRRGRAPSWVLLPTFVAGAATARLALPPEARGALALVAGAWAAAELGLATLLVVRARRLAARARALRAEGRSRLESWEQALGELLGAPRIAAALVLEVAVLAHAAGGWFLRAPAGTFTVHRRRSWPLLAATIAFLVAVETVAVHLLLARVSPLAAWIATASSGYALLWLAGDAHALRLGGLRVEAGAVRIAVGLRWRLTIPREDLAAARLADAAPPGALRADVLWPNLVLELRRPARARGPFGIERATRAIALSVDEPERFIAALAE
jgi:hypothetical protein